nr:hypothetical protein [Candidatus Sigynarchaeota archaeon]
DGTGDQHLVPGSFDLFEHPTRNKVNKKRFAKYSNDVLEFLRTCEENKGIPGRHVHIEALRLPFTLTQLANVGKEYAKIMK